MDEADPRRTLGRKGEELAAEFLVDRGLTVLHRNWRCREGEIDIVAADRAGSVHFCEVKTRAATGFGIAESVTRAKRRRIRRVAQLWLQSYGGGWHEVHFDVISVLWPRSGRPTVEYLPAAF